MQCCSFASSLSRCFAVSWTFYHFGLGETSVPLVMSNSSWSFLLSCITSLCTSSCWYPSELRIRPILPFLLDSFEVIVRIGSFALILSDSYSVMLTLFLMVVVSSGSSVVFEGFVVLVLHVGVQRLVHTFMILTLLLLLTLQFFGHVFSMHPFGLLSANAHFSVVPARCWSSKDLFIVRLWFFHSAVLPLRLESRFYSSSSRFLVTLI